MRKTVFAALLVSLWVSGLTAQEYAVDRGTIIIGGSAEFSSTGGDLFDGRSTMLSFIPQVEYFVARHLAVGGTATMRFVSGGDALPSLTTVGVGPKVFYYFGGRTARVYPFVAGGVSLAQVSFGDAPGLPDLASEVFVVIEPSAGLALMLAKNVAIVPEAFYRWERRDRDGPSGGIDTNRFGLRLGVSVFAF